MVKESHIQVWKVAMQLIISYLMCQLSKFLHYNQKNSCNTLFNTKKYDFQVEGHCMDVDP